MKDLGEAERILGMEIKRDRVKENVSLTQKAYLQKVLQKFDIGCETKSLSTLLAPHFKLSANMSPKTVDEREYVSLQRLLMSVSMSHVSYASGVGSLMYVMVRTRSDLLQAVRMVSRYMHDPVKSHWEAVR